MQSEVRCLTCGVFRVAQPLTERVAHHVLWHRVPPFVFKSQNWFRSSRTLDAVCKWIFFFFFEFRVGNSVSVLLILIKVPWCTRAKATLHVRLREEFVNSTPVPLE